MKKAAATPAPRRRTQPAATKSQCRFFITEPLLTFSYVWVKRGFSPKNPQNPPKSRPPRLLHPQKQESHVVVLLRPPDEIPDVGQDPLGNLVQGPLLAGLQGRHEPLLPVGVHLRVHGLGEAVRVEEQEVPLPEEE